MDIDQAKSTTTADDQMEMTMMMTMMLPDLYGAVDHSSPPPPFTNLISTNPNNNFPRHHSQPPPPYLHQSPPFDGSNYTFPELMKSSSSSSASPASMAAMREMIFRIAAMQPVHIDQEAVKPPKRRNVRISKDPQSVAARHRRERISERIRILQRLVPGGTKMDTASMLDEAIHYVKFLKTQVQSLERARDSNSPCNSSSTNSSPGGMGFPVAMSTGTSYFPIGRGPVREDFRDASS